MLNYIKLAANKETTFDGFNLPVGSIYGRRKNERFVCTNYSVISKEKMKIFVQHDNVWKKETIANTDWRYKEIISYLRQLGYIPKIKPYRDKYVPAKPNRRETNYNYMPTGSGIGQLVRMKYDNADHYGGGSAIRNHESYYSIYKDMDRRYNKNPLYE